MLSTCLAEPIPAGSKTDVLLAKAGPIRNGGNSSVITYLRKKSITVAIADREEQGEHL